MGYYLAKNVDPKDHYVRLALRPNKAKQYSKYRGVTRNRNPKLPYRVAICYQGKKYFIGVFATEVEAAIAYNKHAAMIIGDHAILNVIE